MEQNNRQNFFSNLKTSKSTNNNVQKTGLWTALGELYNGNMSQIKSNLDRLSTTAKDLASNAASQARLNTVNRPQDTYVYPWDSDNESSLTRTLDGYTPEQASWWNKGVDSGELIGQKRSEEVYKPQNENDFISNYRKVTSNLGSRAINGKRSIKTQQMEQQLNLPTYYDALSDEAKEKLRKDYEKDPFGTKARYKEEWDAWNKMNDKYRVRAIQVLNQLSQKERDKVNTLLAADPVEGKKYLDSLINSKTQAENKEIAKLVSPFIDALRKVNKTTADEIDKVINPDKYKIKTPSAEEIAEYEKITAEDTPGVGELDNSGTTKTGTSTNTNTDTGTNTDNEEIIEYTYRPGDTFGQVIKNLGLQTSNGLWDPNGDVEYYTQQLIDQGIWPNGQRGNIPIGTTIRLRRRK